MCLSSAFSKTSVMADMVIASWLSTHTTAQPPLIQPAYTPFGLLYGPNNADVRQVVRMGISSLPATSAAPLYHITLADAPAGAVRPSQTHLSALPTTDAADENTEPALGTMIAILLLPAAVRGRIKARDRAARGVVW